MTKDNFTLVIVFFPNCWNDSVPKVGIYLDGELKINILSSLNMK